jgi:sulfate transport system ATP-binding protein
VFGFLGESNMLPVQIVDGRIVFEGRTLGTAPSDAAAAPAQLYFRPHDVAIGAAGGGGIAARVVGVRRHGGRHRFDLEVGGARHPIEVELTADESRPVSDQMVVRPLHWRLYPVDR